jgi:hypothetical protein
VVKFWSSQQCAGCCTSRLTSTSAVRPSDPVRLSALATPRFWPKRGTGREADSHQSEDAGGEGLVQSGTRASVLWRAWRQAQSEASVRFRRPVLPTAAFDLLDAREPRRRLPGPHTIRR